MKAMKKPVLVEFEFAKKDGEIDTIEGKMSYKKGDAIITGVKGERYPCRRDIFDETYIRIEPLTDSNCEITDEEESKVMAQNDPDIVRFVKMKTGLWLRQDNDIFPSYLLFSDDILFYLMAVSPWNDQIDYVDFHMKTEDETTLTISMRQNYAEYWEKLKKVNAFFDNLIKTSESLEKK